MSIMLIGLGVYYYVTGSTILNFINGGVSTLEGMDAESLEGKTTALFVLPNSRCKASFPGTPHYPSLSQQLFLSGIQSGETRVMADARQVYYLCEFNVPNMEIGLPDSFSGAAPITFTAVNVGFNQTSAPPTNNSIATNANSNSEPLKIQNALDKFTRSWAQDRGASITSNTSIALKGGLFSGRELRGKTRDGKDFRLQFLCNYPRKSMVVIGAIGKAERVESADTAKFLQSMDMW